MKFKAFVTAACLTVASATPGFAVTVNFDGDTYEVTTIEGSFLDNQALLEDQLWWDDIDIAVDFALLVKDSLGLPSFFDGPRFAYELFSSAYEYVNWNDSQSLVLQSVDIADIPSVHAIATPVPIPLPASAAFLAAGLAGMVAMGRRKRKLG